MSKLVLLLTVLLIASIQPVSAGTLSVSFNGAELRSTPSAMGGESLGSLERYSPVVVLEEGPEYFRVRDSQGRTGHVHRTLLATISTLRVAGGLVNVRSGPGTASPVLFQLPKNRYIRLLEKSDGWVKVLTADEKSGWVADFLVTER